MLTSKWMTAGTMLKMNAINYPDKLGWQDKLQEFTFKQWNDRACRVANGLKDLGVKQKDAFAVIAFNRGEWMDIYAGCSKAGRPLFPSCSDWHPLKSPTSWGTRNAKPLSWKSLLWK